jgi:hypothetical protein
MRQIAGIYRRTLFLGVAAFALLTPMALGQMAAISQANPALDGTVSLTLTAHGFQPKQLGIKAGRYGMILQNRSPMESVSINVTQDGTSSVVLSSQHTRAARDVWHFTTIQPGTYHLSASGHPAWTCTLTVVSK